MKVKSFRFRQSVITLVTLLSFFVSAASAACLCSHHEEISKSNLQASCQEHSEHADSLKSATGEKAYSVKLQNSFSNVGCCCIQQTIPKISAKSENAKFDDQAAGISPLAVVSEPTFLVREHRNIKIEFAKPLYLSDSFYNLTPGRAPPRL